MSGPFDKELESIANAHTQEFARKLAHEVAGLVLRRLGIDPTALESKSPPSEKKKVAPPPAKAAPAVKPPPAKAAPAKAAAPAKKAAPAAPRENGGDRTTVVEKVLRVVSGREGVAVADVVKATSLDRAPVAAALKALKEERRIFMGGSRRFARYAMTPAAAEQASQAARKGG